MSKTKSNPVLSQQGADNVTSNVSKGSATSDSNLSCAICNGLLYAKKGYDPFPLRSEGQCCKTCYRSFVIPVRLIDIRRMNMPLADAMTKAKRDQAEGTTDGGKTLPLIYFKPYVHCYLIDNMTACGRPIKPRGRHLSTRTIGTSDDVTCPECLDYLQQFQAHQAKKAAAKKTPD